jgi:hypothetical protein
MDAGATDLNGNHASPSQHPNIINNSWGGRMGLLWSANPTLKANIATTTQLLQEHANHNVPAGDCGRPGSSNTPNYTFGCRPTGRADYAQCGRKPHGARRDVYLYPEHPEHRYFDRFLRHHPSGQKWPATASNVLRPLGPGQSAQLIVTVKVPATAVAGTTDRVIVQVNSQADPGRVATAVLATTADAVYGLTLAPATAAAAGSPGGALRYSLTITNTGNMHVSFISQHDSGKQASATLTTTVSAVNVFLPGVLKR